MKCLVEQMRAGALKVTTVYLIVKIAVEIQTIQPPNNPGTTTSGDQPGTTTGEPTTTTFANYCDRVCSGAEEGANLGDCCSNTFCICFPQEILKCLVKMKMKAGVLNKEPALRIVRTVVKL